MMKNYNGEVIEEDISNGFKYTYKTDFNVIWGALLYKTREEQREGRANMGIDSLCFQ